jgi:hypothetical protein
LLLILIKDSFSFDRQKNCLSSLEKNKGKLQLHAVGISTPPNFVLASGGFAASNGFATTPACQEQIRNLANLSKYSNSYLQLDGCHTYMSTSPNGAQMFHEILDFAYTNREDKLN